MFLELPPPVACVAEPKHMGTHAAATVTTGPAVSIGAPGGNQPPTASLSPGQLWPPHLAQLGPERLAPPPTQEADAVLRWEVGFPVSFPSPDGP